jgi:hypothetical protein
LPPAPPVVPAPTAPTPAPRGATPMFGPGQPFGAPPEGPAMPPTPTGDLRLQPSNSSDAKPPAKVGSTDDSLGTMRFSSYNDLDHEADAFDTANKTDK